MNQVDWMLMVLAGLALLLYLYTYLGYPVLLRNLAAAKKCPPPADPPDWPRVFVLIAAYNEVSVIEEKIQTLLTQDYPRQKLEIHLGSDGSDDGTVAIVERMAQADDRIHLHAFTTRRGKPPVINSLVAHLRATHLLTEEDLLLFTDANVLLPPNTIRRLARHFQQEDIVVVDAHMQQLGQQPAGISRAETAYLGRETRLKHDEGQLWGTMIGPFGGCFMLRATAFTDVPPNFLVDDFYICMKAMTNGGRAINDLEAIAYEQATHDWRSEFRRKARITAGNYQNMVYLRHLWLPPWRDKKAFAFFSHKILRWIGPWLLLTVLLCWGALAVRGNILSRLLLVWVLIAAVGLPVLDILLRQLGIHLLILRAWRYFLLMNVAQLAGFLRYIKGIKSNVWQPTTRN